MLRLKSNTAAGYHRILKRLAAAGLSRILDHMWKGPFGIISASIGGPDDISRTATLKNLLKEQGRGFIDLQGGYLYKEIGRPTMPVREASVFIPNISEEDLKALAEKFNQESYIFGQRGDWSMINTVTGAVYSEGSVADTFEPLRQQEIDEDTPYMSQMRGGTGRQFRLDPDLIHRRRHEQEQLSRDQHKRRVAMCLVAEVPCFYSIAGEFRPRPPVHLSPSDISLSGTCPDGALLDCWLPLQKI